MGNDDFALCFVSMSSLNSIKEVLRKIKPELTMKYYVKSIGLFGSIVPDDFTLTKSDVDIIGPKSRPE